jgi:hypothetical protein
MKIREGITRRPIKTWAATMKLSDSSKSRIPNMVLVLPKREKKSSRSRAWHGK